MLIRSFFLFLLFFPLAAWSQGGIVPLHSPTSDRAERLFLRTGQTGNLHAEIKGYSQVDLARYAADMERQSDSSGWSDADRADIRYIQERCGTPKRLFSGHQEKLDWRIYPMLQINVGKETGTTDATIWSQQLGAGAEVSWNHRFYLSANITEHREALPTYVNRWTDIYGAVPGAPSYKTYRSGLWGTETTRRYALPSMVLGIQATRHIGVETGYGNVFVGQGYRSVLMSDMPAPAWFVKINTRIWKFHYQNLFARLAPGKWVDPNVDPRKKYIAAHYLSLQLTPRWTVGLFETTTLGRNQHFELQYLNPVILYRSVEGIIGSPDNVLVGLHTHFNWRKRWQLYGQFALDEFVFKEILARDGWWANKFAWQTGIRHLNIFGVEHLDVQAEWNGARPYMWSHYDTINSYSHGGQPLAHTLGSNFKEWVFLVQWQPSRRWNVALRLLAIQQSDDPDGENYGSNILKSYLTRVADYGNVIGQGIGSRVWRAGASASYEISSDIFWDFNVLLRNKDSENSALDLKNTIFSTGVRWNVWNNHRDF